MKQILKKSKVFILGGLLLFFSCTHEKDFVNEKNHRLKITEKSFDELSRITSFKSALKKIPKKKPISDFASDSRSAIEEEFDFFFSKQPAKVIERDDKTSYTFLILRSVKDLTYFENLIIEVNKDMKSRAVITKYIPSEPLTTEHVNKFDFTGNINTIKLFDEINPNAGDLVMDFCIEVFVSNCLDAGTDNDCFGSICGWSYFSICSSNGGSNGSGSTGSTSSGTSGPGGGPSPTDSENPNNDNNVITFVVPPVVAPPKIPCKQLADLLKQTDSVYTNEFNMQDTIKSPKLKNEITLIAPNVNSTAESAYELEYSIARNKYKSTFVPPTANFSVAMYTGPSYYGSIHIHPLNSVGIPSIGDMVWLRNCYLKANKTNKEKAVAIVVVKNPDLTGPTTITYALKIDNFTTFTAQLTTELNKFPGTTENDKILNALSDESNYYGANRLTDDKLFLQRYSSIGASLYKADSNLTKFEKLALTGNTVVKQPCIESQQ